LEYDKAAIYPQYLFNMILEAMIRRALESVEVAVHMDGKTVNSLRFVDDIDLIAESLQDLQQIKDKVHRSKRFGLRINEQKTKVTVGA